MMAETSVSTSDAVALYAETISKEIATLDVSEVVGMVVGAGVRDGSGVGSTDGDKVGSDDGRHVGAGVGSGVKVYV